MTFLNYKYLDMQLYNVLDCATHTNLVKIALNINNKVKT